MAEALAGMTGFMATASRMHRQECIPGLLVGLDMEELPEPTDSGDRPVSVASMEEAFMEAAVFTEVAAFMVAATDNSYKR
jgi:hypothetical protein